MTDLSRADVVVALRWQAREMEEGWHPTIPLEIAERAAILRALADSLEQGQEAWQWADGDTIDIAPHSERPRRGDSVEDKWRPVWIIPEPKVKP